MQDEIVEEIQEELWAHFEADATAQQVKNFFEEMVADDCIWADLAHMRHCMEHRRYNG